jgi:hypothetical protein
MFSLPKMEPAPVKTKTIGIRKADYVPYGVVAGETISGNLPRDHFIHSIRLRVVEGTLSGGSSPAWVAGSLEKLVKSITIRADGGKYFKQMSWAEAKQICVVNGEKQTDGYVKLYFVDPKIPQAKPIPSWIFTSLVIQIEWEALQAATITTGSPTGTAGTKVEVTLSETKWTDEDIREWPTLVEVVRTKSQFGTNTLWQNFEHERANVVMGYLYHCDDNGTDSDAIFDKLRVIGRQKDSEFIAYDEVDLLEIREANKNAFQGQALATGFFMIEWPKGLPTSEFTSLKSQLYIDSAGTNAGLRVLERYVL